VLAAAAMAMSSVSVVTNALRLRGFKRPTSAREILHPSLRSVVGDYAYLVGIGVLALVVGLGALSLARSTEEVTATAMTAEAAGIRAEVVTQSTLTPGVSTRVVYRLADARSGAPITDVIVSHERPVHLIAVSRDLTHFQHIHPQPTGNAGEYGVDATFPVAGTYVLYAGFERSGGREVVSRQELVVGSASGPAALVERREPVAAPPGVRVALQNAANVRAGSEHTFTFRLEDPRTGEPVRTLTTYLGAPAHVVVIDAAASEFVHTHGMVADARAGAGMAGMESTQPPYGPELSFTHAFATPGLYKIWGQFQTRDGQVVTADFVIQVN
jgi:Cu+-exporting ATPase